MVKTPDQLLSDMDRCPHGRHEGDKCAGWRGPGKYDGGCRGGLSLGNPFARPGQAIGFDLYGRPLVVPKREDKGVPDQWYTKSEEGRAQVMTALASIGDELGAVTWGDQDL